ncbi:hypothetical protein BOTBODRAFT_32911, partial [Botryobasidium botryosum FD-172 SS1]
MRLAQFPGAARNLAVVLLTVSALPVGSVELKQLTGEDFKSSTSKGMWLVEYFSPFCGHCKQFEPTWEKLVEDKAKFAESFGFKMAQVNCITQGDLCTENSIDRYPSIRLYKDGEQVEQYNGDRDYERLAEFIDMKSRTYALESTAPETPAPARETYPNPMGEVLVLDSSSFARVIESGSVFVKFFAPWCGHCKRLAPTWKQLAENMKNIANIAEVNCDDNRSLCLQQGVEGYPTLLFYHGGQKSEYNGGRALEAMERFVTKGVSIHLEVIDNEQFPNILKKDTVFYMYLHSPSTSKEHISSVTEATRALLGHPTVYESRDPELFKRFSLDPAKGPVIVAIKDHASEPFDIFALSDHPNQPMTSKWLVDNKLPTVQELDSDNFQSVMRAPSSPLVAPSIIDPADRIKAEEVLLAAAKAWKAKAPKDARPVVFVWMNVHTWADWLKRMYGITAADVPRVVLADHQALIYYDTDKSGASVGLEGASIMSVLEGIHSGAIASKHSENIFERTMRSLDHNLTNLGNSIVAHPFITLFTVVLSMMGIYRILKRCIDAEAAQYPEKDPNRLD